MGTLDVCSLKHGHKKIEFNSVAEIIKDEIKKDLLLCKLQMKYRLSAKLKTKKKLGKDKEESIELVNGADEKNKDMTMDDLEEILEKNKTATDLLLTPPISGG